MVIQQVKLLFIVVDEEFKVLIKQVKYLVNFMFVKLVKEVKGVMEVKEVMVVMEFITYEV